MSGEKQMEDSATFTGLPNKRVKISPVMRGNGWITDPEHEAFFLLGNSTINVTVPRDRNGHFICPLNEAERAWFEDKTKSGMSFEPGELSPYKKKDNFWQKYKLRLGKDVKELDLSRPTDYLDYKVCLVNKDLVAPDANNKYSKASIKYMIVSDDYEMNSRLTTRDKQKEAYKFFGKIEDNVDEMISFLKVYGKKVPTDASSKWLKDEIGRIMDEKLDAFLEIANDKDRSLRVIIEEAVELGIIIKENRKYFLQGGEPLCGPGEVPVIATVVAYLKNKKNQELMLEISAKVKKAKD
jgi:hypothetical protein